MVHSRGKKRVWSYFALLVCVLCAAYGLNRVPSISLWAEPVGFYMYGGWANVRSSVLMRDAPAEFEVTDEDRSLYPSKNFAFKFETERGFLIDTFEGLVGKDMGAIGDTVVAVVITPEAVCEIYETALAIHVFDYPEPRLPYGSSRFDEHCVGEVKLTVRSGETLKTFSWHAGNQFYGRHYEDWVRLYHLVELMMFVGHTSEAYLALPRGRAAYI